MRITGNSRIITIAMISKFIQVNHARAAVKRLDTKNPSFVVKKPISEAPKPTLTDGAETVATT